MQEWERAVQAAQSKKAQDVSVLHIAKVSTMTDVFVICSGGNSRQVQAISDAVQAALKQEGVRPAGVEGYRQGHWVLLDYGYFIVHVFAPEPRKFYDLERLWKNAPRLPVPEAA